MMIRGLIDEKTPHHSGAGFYDCDEIDHYNEVLIDIRTGRMWVTDLTFDDICYILLSMGLDTPESPSDFTFPVKFAPPSAFFWEMWRADKPGLKAWGFHIYKDAGNNWNVAFDMDLPNSYFKRKYGWEFKPREARKKPYFCKKCAKKHMRGKIYSAHLEFKEN